MKDSSDNNCLREKSDNFEIIGHKARNIKEEPNNDVFYINPITSYSLVPDAR
jgi:hypothetical protein